MRINMDWYLGWLNISNGRWLMNRMGWFVGRFWCRMIFRGRSWLDISNGRWIMYRMRWMVSRFRGWMVGRFWGRMVGRSRVEHRAGGDSVRLGQHPHSRNWSRLVGWRRCRVNWNFNNKWFMWLNISKGWWGMNRMIGAVRLSLEPFSFVFRVGGQFRLFFSLGLGDKCLGGLWGS